MHSRSRVAPLYQAVRRTVEPVRLRAGRVFGWILDRPSRSIWVSGVVGFGLAAVMTIIAGFPPPHVHDEFSYLLAGDTFASGRLSNPTHPMWRHFETFHVLQVPTYASKYPPAQGAFLALGELARLPIAGVWLSCGLFVAALNWMLTAWTRPRWALYGALAAALWVCGRHAGAGYWTWSYWGGSVAALGSALLLGGVRRLATESTIAAALATGVGVAMIANSRPYEGLFFVLTPAVVVIRVLWRLLQLKQVSQVLRAAVPMLLVLVMTGAFMGVYNARITGSATRPPYLEYEKQYNASPALLGQAVPETPQYRIPVMEQFYSRGGAGATRHRANWRAHIRYLRDERAEILSFYVPWFVGPLLFAFPWLPRAGWVAVAMGCVAMTAVGASFSLYALQPHYVAPIAAAWCLLLTLSARFVSQLRWQRLRVGRGIVALITLCLSLSVATEMAAGVYRRLGRSERWWRQRQTMERQLSKSGKHLVLVAYGPSHDSNAEWVHNRADIDAAPVVWARSLGESRDAELRRYFADRSAWQLVVQYDTGQFALTPLPATSTPQSQRQ